MWVLLALLLSFAALTVTVLARPSLRRHFELRDFALAAVGAALALMSVRNTAICVAVMIPAWMAMAAGLLRSLDIRRSRQSAGARSRRAAPVMGAALIAIGVFGVGAVGARVARSASPQGIAAAYPACATALLARSPTTQRVFTAYGTGGYVIYRLWPQASVYEYGRIDIARHRGLRPLPAHRRRCDHNADRVAVAGVERHHRGALIEGRSHRRAQRHAGWTLSVDDHGMLLFLRGDPSWAMGASCATAAPG